MLTPSWRRDSEDRVLYKHAHAFGSLDGGRDHEVVHEGHVLDGGLVELKLEAAEDGRGDHVQLSVCEAREGEGGEKLAYAHIHFEDI